MTKEPIDFDKAKLNPASVFTSPEAIGRNVGLTCEQKLELLRRWEYDASELSVAEEEGMAGGEPSMLARVMEALETLSNGIDTEHSPPTKQGGLQRTSVKCK